MRESKKSVYLIPNLAGGSETLPYTARFSPLSKHGEGTGVRFLHTLMERAYNHVNDGWIKRHMILRNTTLLLLLILAFSPLRAQTETAPTLPPCSNGGKIAFTSNQGGNFEVYTVN